MSTSLTKSSRLRTEKLVKTWKLFLKYPNRPFIKRDFLKFGVVTSNNGSNIYLNALVRMGLIEKLLIYRDMNLGGRSKGICYKLKKEMKNVH